MLIFLLNCSGWSCAASPPAATEARGAAADGQRAAAGGAAAASERAGTTAEAGCGPQRLLEKRKWNLPYIYLCTYMTRYLLYV